MTFLNPWAIDGARINSSLARLASFAALGGAEGIISKGDLKVRALSPNGNGLVIGGGGAIILNRYQQTPSQAYVVSNADDHIVTAAQMPTPQVSERFYLVCVTIGDPEFSQVGHPWMPSSVPAQDLPTFQYVRPFLVPCSSGTTSFEELGYDYPAYAPARLRVPANTTTITDAMLTDLRELARPRSSEHIKHVSGLPAKNSLNGAGGTPGSYERWPDVAVVTVKVPTWAVIAKITGFVEGVNIEKAADAKLRVAIAGKSLSTTVTNISEITPSKLNERRAYNVGGEIDVSSVAGQTVTFITEGTPNNTASKGAIFAIPTSSVQIRVRFEEVAS